MLSRYLSLSLLCCVLSTWLLANPDLPTIPDRVFEVTRFGAVADGKTDSTAAIVKTLKAADEAGGGRIEFPAGEGAYLSAPIELPGKVELHFPKGAVLQPLPFDNGSNRPGTYPLNGARYDDFITAKKVTDIALTGEGLIWGDGEAWWNAFRENKKMPHRPYLIKFSQCERVLVENINLRHSPMFHLAFGETDHVTIRHLNIDTPEDAPNSDGVDPAGSHYLIENSRITTGDDNIAIKAGGSYCSDIVIRDCWFGTGHGLSVGGQSNRGLDGLTVERCVFERTTSGLRLKADPTQGGPSRNLSYSDITMRDVTYPIVFYSYYNKVGNPGNGKFTPDKVQDWNTTPPNDLSSVTLPTWSDISIRNLTVTGASKYSIIWGLPTAAGLIQRVHLENVNYSGDYGIMLYNTADVCFAGENQFSIAKDRPAFVTCNSLNLVRQPVSQTAAAGADVHFEVQSEGQSGAHSTAPNYQWLFNGHPLRDGTLPDGKIVAGSQTPKLTVSHLQPNAEGDYTVEVSNRLDGYDTKTKALEPDSLSVRAVSAPAHLTVH